MSEDEQAWRGVRFPEQGQLRIVNLTARVDDEGQVGLDPVEVEIRSGVWHHWLLIAARHARAALAARDGNPGIDAEAGFDAAVTEEMRESMISIGASAFTFEAFRASVALHLIGDPVRAQSTDGRVHQTIARAFRLTNQQSKAARRDLQQIFRLRDRAVHPSAAFATPSRHPVFPVSMEGKYVAFRSENALAAAGLAHGLTILCLSRPRQGIPGLTEWCEGMMRVLPTELNDQA